MKSLAAMIAVVAAAGTLAAGCNSSDTSEAKTPAGAPTVANTALQTDSAGKTITAPPAEGTPPPAKTGATPPAGGGGAAKGDVAAGLTVFQNAGCTGCHNGDGKQAGGIGPQLAGRGVDETAIRTIIENGKAPMPANLVSGTDEDNVVAYVLSLQ
jgi:Cytochrome C oxidase, cbb3-type, subunit III